MVRRNTREGTIYNHLIEPLDPATLTIHQLRERDALLMHAMTSPALSDADYH